MPEEKEDERVLDRETRYLTNLSNSKARVVESGKATHLKKMAARGYTSDPNILEFSGRVDKHLAKIDSLTKKYTPDHPMNIKAQEAREKILSAKVQWDSTDESIKNLAKSDIKHTKLIDGKIVADPKAIRGLGKVGKVGLIGAAGAGTAVYIHDRHQANTTNAHPALKYIPDNIRTPSARIRRTQDYNIPTNFTTDALDIAGEKIPVGWKVEAGWKDHKLKTGKYTPGPLIGNIKFTPDTPVEGSRLKSIAYLNSNKGGVVQVGGHSTGIAVDLGNKERWSTQTAKRNKLNTRNNSRLTQADKERVAMQLDPDIKDDSDSYTQLLQDLYGSNQDIQGILSDPDEMEHLRNRNKTFYMNKSLQNIGKRNDTRTTREIRDMERASGISIHGNTQDAALQERDQERAREALQQRRAFEAGIRGHKRGPSGAGPDD